jgi:hypothetical protein
MYIFDVVESHHGEFKYDARIKWIKYSLIREARARPLFIAVARLSGLKYML